jgi:hypothetical protein
MTPLLLIGRDFWYAGRTASHRGAICWSVSAFAKSLWWSTCRAANPRAHEYAWLQCGCVICVGLRPWTWFCSLCCNAKIKDTMISLHNCCCEGAPLVTSDGLQHAHCACLLQLYSILVRSVTHSVMFADIQHAHALRHALHQHYA